MCLLVPPASKHAIVPCPCVVGCFWGLELAYQRVPGVTHTSVGYTGGKDTEPDYRKVCSGRTGHAEAVQVRARLSAAESKSGADCRGASSSRIASGTAVMVQVYFKPQEVTYEKLLEEFFSKVDPTTLNRQGNDSGTQYRSVSCARWLLPFGQAG